MENQLSNVFLLDSSHIETTYISENINEINFSLLYDDEKISLNKEKDFVKGDVHRIIFSTNKKIELGHILKLKTSEEEEAFVRLDRYVATKEFDELYAYEDKLGLSYSKEETKFRLWSPLSEKVFLKLEKGENNFVLIPMVRKDKGVYKVTVKGDLFNKKYNFVIYQNNIQKVITDPYGKAVDENSVHSVVIDIDDIKKMGIVKPHTEIKNASDAIIYELHIRDFTGKDEKNERKGTYLGLLNRIDYLKKLGITHIQLLPVIDFDDVDDLDKSKYNWGYNPISFFALEGSYSIYPEDALARLVEFKTLVNELHKNDIRVVMDVVYNHLFDYITTDFQKNIPYYYFRRNGKKMANASGCGNDVASERKMVRRIICDSIRYFLEVFDVDGFRFDLMGLIDIETSKRIVKIRNEIKPDALLYGEGWNMGVELKAEEKTSTDNSHLIPEIGFFNDRFRDVIKGSTFDRHSPGYILGNINNYFEIDDVIFGSLLSNRYDNFSQSINYVECHDNQTLYDKLSYFSEDEETNLKRVKFANALTILSMGVPFIHMGQEIGQSKELLDNTYNVSDINDMDWNLVNEREEMVDYLKDLISLRKKLGYSEVNNINDLEGNMDAIHLENGLLIVKITNKKFLLDNINEAVIVINPTEKNLSYEFDDYYRLYFSFSGFVKGDYFCQNYISPSLSIAVLVK